MTSAIERAIQAVGPERFLDSLSVQEQQALAHTEKEDVPEVAV